MLRVSCSSCAALWQMSWSSRCTQDMQGWARTGICCIPLSAARLMHQLKGMMSIQEQAETLCLCGHSATVWQAAVALALHGDDAVQLAALQLAHCDASTSVVWFDTIMMRPQIIPRVCQGPDLPPRLGVLWCVFVDIPAAHYSTFYPALVRCGVSGPTRCGSV
jgi:hypothetical protein